ncbi:MAG: tyrosine-type recombinase/integrase [Candidatus Nanopelagicales bacterium]
MSTKRGSTNATEPVRAGTVKKQRSSADAGWIALWPRSIDPSRGNVTPGVAYPNAEAAEAALAAQVAAYQEDPSNFPHLVQPVPPPLHSVPASEVSHPRAPRNPRPKADFSDGTVRQLRSGRFRAQWPRRIDPDERNINPNGRTYATEAEARTALRETLIRQYSHPEEFVLLYETDEETATRTVAFITAEFIRTDAADLSPSTVAGYRSSRRVVCHPQHGIGDRVAAELTHGDLFEWRNVTMKDAGVSKYMRQGAYRFLSSVLSREVELDNIPVNPALGSTARRRRASNNDERPAQRVVLPSRKQEMDLAMATPTKADRLLLLVLMWSGPRFAEAASILPDRLDGTSNKIFIDKKWQRRSRTEGWELRPLKTGEARDLQLPAGLMSALITWRDNHWQPPVDGRKPVLFPYVAASGVVHRAGVGVWEASTWRSRVMLPARAIAGLPTIRTKDLRTNAASNFHDAGFSHAQVQELLGHSAGSSVTMRHYVRPAPARASAAFERIRMNAQLSSPERLSRMWDAWLKLTGSDPTV